MTSEPQATPYLIDTSVWVHALVKRTPRTRVQERVSELIAAKQAATHPIVRLELLRGARDKSAFERIRSILAPLPSLELDAGSLEDAADLGFLLRRAGVTVPTTDLIVAASAIRAGAIVLHLDADYNFIADHTALRVESLLGG